MNYIKKFLLVLSMITIFNFIIPNKELVENMQFKQWTTENIGYLTLNSQVTNIDSKSRHVFITLGSKLNDDGHLEEESINRLKATLRAFNYNKDAYIIVSGGNPKNNVTEAKAMKIWLQKHDVPKDQIIEEGLSKNTIENALYSMDIVNKMKFNSITLVTSDTHMRRAYVLFESVDYQTKLVSNLVPYITPNAKIYTNKEKKDIENNLKELNLCKKMTNYCR
ncbi:YdcF family protein (plasmid) [Staphylococcus xylosus]|uniref:YdcF family protein n=1 Tax=Staphylococcus xylosus TaxID=1288 RepID=UPI00403EAD76